MEDLLSAGCGWVGVSAVRLHVALLAVRHEILKVLSLVGAVLFGCLFPSSCFFSTALPIFANFLTTDNKVAAACTAIKSREIGEYQGVPCLLNTLHST